MSRISRAMVCALAFILILSGCGQDLPILTAVFAPQAEPQPAVSAPVEPEVPQPEPAEPVPQPPVVPEQPEPEPYDFSRSVPQNEAVENSYFEDAAFIGDSRTDGFMLYSGIGCGENLTSTGISIFALDSKKALKKNGQSYTLLEALELGYYGKVYLSLGVNELGVHDDEGFYQAYCDAIDAIRASQPEAVIYIQGLIPLNEDIIMKTSGKTYLRNDRLLVYNDLMKKAAEEKQVAFLDLNPYFAGEDGQLPADASNDGVHLKRAGCEKWLEYLRTHTVDYETLYPEEELDNETIDCAADGGTDDAEPERLPG